MPLAAEESNPPRTEKRDATRKKSAGAPRPEAYMPDQHRTLPYSAEAEMGVLSSMLIAPREIIGECVEMVDDKHFHLPAHATIFAVLVEFWNDNKPLDFITLTQVLKDRGILDQVGGPFFVTNLFTYVPTAANVHYYLGIVREKFILRQIIRDCTEAAARAYDEQDDVDGLLDEVEQKVFAITDQRTTGKLPTMREQVMAAFESIEALYDRKGGISGLSTGFSDLDRMTDGLHAAQMFVIAARPSMGKTALAMNIAEHVALHEQKPVAVFSLEMSAQQLVQRLLCSNARVDMGKVRNGLIHEQGFHDLTTAASLLAKSRMFIDDTPSISILEFRAKARRLKAQENIELIVVDYLQLLRSTSRRAQDNRQLEIAEISAGMKALAKELNIPIVVLAQLNRNPESRSGESKGRPRLSDLRESGSIEQDADVVGLLVREEYYADTDEEKEASEGKATLILAKQRNGPTGEVALTFLKQFTRFEDRAPEVAGAA